MAFWPLGQDELETPKKIQSSPGDPIYAQSPPLNH